MKLTTLEAYVQEKKREYIEENGELDGYWYDEDIIWAIQEYVSMKGEFTEEDVEFLHRTEFEPEDFIDIEEDY